MGVLNRLFGNKAGIVKEIKLDEDEIMRIWRLHLASYEERDNLSKFFRIDRLDNAVTDLDALSDVLEKIKNTLNADLIDIKDEERLEKEVIKDIEGFLSFDNKSDNSSLVWKIKKEKDIDKKTVSDILRKVYQILNNELHAIKIIKEKINLLKEIREKKLLEDRELKQKEELPNEVKILLKNLFLLICHQEPSLYPALSQRCLDKAHFDEVDRAIRAVLLDKEFKKEFKKKEVAVEGKFSEMVEKIFAKSGEPKGSYWKLAEAVFDELLEQINEGAPFGNDFDRLFPIFEKKMNDDSVLDQILMKHIKPSLKERIRKKYPELTDEQVIKGIREAFKRSYSELHFEDLEADMIR